MKVIDEFYLITLTIILIGLPTLFYLKLNQPDVYTYNIAIYGDDIDASMLAYYIDRHVEEEHLVGMNFNITLISPPQISSEEVEEGREVLDKKLISFCGVEKEWMKLVSESNLKYYIKEYGINFGEMVEGAEKNQFRIYSMESSSFIKSLADYGLSHYSAQNYFLKFAQNINKTVQQGQRKYTLDEMSISHIVKDVFPSPISSDGLKYFSETLGLDQNYINDFILPVILGNYFHSTNSLSALYKLLPVYCHKRPNIGESLVLFEYPKRIKQKILLEVVHAKLNYINNKRLESYSIIKDSINDKKKYVNVMLSQKSNQTEEQNELFPSNKTLRTYFKSDILFIFQNIESPLNEKKFSYYKTIIDGKIKDDHLYEQFFTIYLKPSGKKRESVKPEQKKKEKDQTKQTGRGGTNYIYSITRICAYNCKGYESSVYILISKHKLSSSKNLNMFESHNIIDFKKYFMSPSQIPTNKKIQENQNVYKIYDVDSISDSYELHLNLAREISTAFINKIKKQYFND